MTRVFQAGQRLLVQNALKGDEKVAKEVIEYQQKQLTVMGTLQHHDAITGTSKYRAIKDFSAKAVKGVETANAMIAKHLKDQVSGVSIKSLDPVLVSQKYSDKYETLMVLYNPAYQGRKELIELEVPFHDFALWEVDKQGKSIPVEFEKSLQRQV